MPKKKNTVDTAALEEVAKLHTDDKSAVEETPKMTKEEMESKKDEIKHEWAKRIMFQMYRHQITECLNYMLNHRLSIDKLRELINDKKADRKELHSASRDFIMKIDPIAFVELVKLLNPNIDFSMEYGEDEKLLVRSNNEKEESNGDE